MILQEKLEVLFFKLKICYTSSHIDKDKYNYIISLINKIKYNKNPSQTNVILKICSSEIQNSKATYKYLLKLISYLLLIDREVALANNLKWDIINFLRRSHDKEILISTRWWNSTKNHTESIQLGILILLAIDNLQLTEEEKLLLINCFTCDGYKRATAMFSLVSDNGIYGIYTTLRMFNIQDELIYLAYISSSRSAKLPNEVQISQKTIKQSYLIAKSHKLKEVEYILIPIVHKIYSPYYVMTE